MSNVAPKQVDYEILAAKHVKDEGLAEMLMCIEHDWIRFQQERI